MNDRLAMDPAYRRLKTGRRSIFQTHLSCWLAADHLLVVEVVGHSERYSRFDLRDIQAVVLQPSRARSTATWIGTIGLLPALALLVALLSSVTVAGMESLVVLAFLALPPIAALAWAAWAGPLCSNRISTAVQVARLPALHNLPLARAFARELLDAALAREAGPADPANPAVSPSPSPS